MYHENKATTVWEWGGTGLVSSSGVSVSCEVKRARQKPVTESTGQ